MFCCHKVNFWTFLSYLLKIRKWSLVLWQWLRICFAMQGTWIQSLVRELRSCMPHGGAKNKKRVNHWSWNMFSGYKDQYLSAVLRFSFPEELLWKSSTPVSWSWFHPQRPHDKHRQELSPPWRSDLALGDFPAAVPWTPCNFLCGHPVTQCFWAAGW